MQLDRWRGRSALVTGASSGIGAAVASALATKVGMRVAVLARREERLNALAADCQAQGAEILVCGGDVSNDDDVARCFEQLRAQWGGIDLLVNNAGSATMSPLTQGDPKDWREILDINVAAPAQLIQQALQDMTHRDEGQIINVSSIYAHRDQVPNFALYHASKAALRSLTNTLRAELAAAGKTIRVGMISPGMVATEFRAQATGGAFTYESYFEHYEPMLPEDVVGAVLYMLSTRPHIQVQDILLSPLGQGL
ncbi:SDR family oxidoreductase [Candidatus Entotheonella palauensis]|uniref:Ketoreductase domain-containing protein n=1 Tax=Candidatus Entotheonella gemina TaxID=1429439 RepID=W4MET8_9BACT|nr:SDR family NAD(P)-dependent oxidoreductase [Candidatus Entotheonella palauensis]ETX08839.1 MAG: hypothetical protein ETSY2_03010 [Candidatus Entotheonella gemina]